MRLEAVRIVADWLKDPTNGVNALLPGVLRDIGDDLPPLLAEGPDDLAAVYDVTRHEWVRKRQDPPARPCLYITTEGSFDLHGEEMVGTYVDTKTSVIVIVRYLAARSNTEKGTTDGEYTIRAIRQSIKRLMQQGNDPARTRNGIAVFNWARCTYYPVTETIGEHMVSGAVALHFDVRDANP